MTCAFEGRARRSAATSSQASRLILGCEIAAISDDDAVSIRFQDVSLISIRPSTPDERERRADAVPLAPGQDQASLTARAIPAFESMK